MKCCGTQLRNVLIWEKFRPTVFHVDSLTYINSTGMQSLVYTSTDTAMKEVHSCSAFLPYCWHWWDVVTNLRAWIKASIKWMTSTGSTNPQKFRQKPNPEEAMLIVIYHCEGVFLTYAVPTGQTFNAECNCRFLQHICVRLCCAKIFARSFPIFFSDNSCSHVSYYVTNPLQWWDWEIWNTLRTNLTFVYVTSYSLLSWENPSEP